MKVECVGNYPACGGSVTGALPENQADHSGERIEARIGAGCDALHHQSRDCDAWHRACDLSDPVLTSSCGSCLAQC